VKGVGDEINLLSQQILGRSLTFELGVGLTQSFEGLNRTKRCTFQSKRKFSADCLQISSTPSALLGLYPSTHAVTDFGLISLHNHMGRFLILNIFVDIHTRPTGSVSLRNLTNVLPRPTAQSPQI
jgi:hypothetical protein